MAYEMNKKNNLKKVSDNKNQNCYVGYKRYPNLYELNIDRFKEQITYPLLFTNSLTNQLEVLSL